MTDGSAYIYTQHAEESIRRLVQAHYLPHGPTQCRFYVSSLHDNYLIENAGHKYMLRLYRSDWRSEEEALFELELLDFLQERQAPVAGPLRTQAGTLAVALESPEGQRLAALFQYAEGRAPEAAITPEECRLLGSEVARVHHAAESFTTSYTRPLLALPHLVDEPIELIAPYLNAEARVYLEGLQSRLHRAWPDLPREAGVYGPCAGDINCRNFHITAGRKITLFDFDQCGYGHRVFEIAKFASSIHHHRTKQALVEAFLTGYQQVRKLGEAELFAMPYYEMASVIWVLGIAVKNVSRIGYKYMEKPYWGRKIEILKVLEAQQQARPVT